MPSMEEQSYGTWKNWLLCLGIIIFCVFPSMSRRRKKKPEDKPQGAATTITPISTIPEPSSPWKWSWLRSLLGPSIAATGWQIMSGGSYLLGTLIIYLGFLVWIAEACFDPALPQRRYLRWPLSLIGLIFAILFTVNVVLRKPPLNTYAFAMRNGNPAEGTDVDGIKWNPHFTELEIIISSPRDNDFNSVNLLVVPDTWTYSVVLSDHPAGCNLEPKQIEVRTIAHVTSSGNVRPTSAAEDGTFEIHDNQGNVYRVVAWKGAYHLTCDRLPGLSTVKIISAVVSPKSNPSSPEVHSSDHDLDFMLGSRPSPSALTFIGRYNLGSKQFTLNKITKIDDGDSKP